MSRHSGGSRPTHRRRPSLGSLRRKSGILLGPLELPPLRGPTIASGNPPIAVRVAVVSAAMILLAEAALRRCTPSAPRDEVRTLPKQFPGTIFAGKARAVLAVLADDVADILGDGGGYNEAERLGLIHHGQPSPTACDPKLPTVVRDPAVFTAEDRLWISQVDGARRRNTPYRTWVRFEALCPQQDFEKWRRAANDSKGG